MDLDVKPIDLCSEDTTCSVCYAEFLDSDDLNIHMLQHLECNSKNYCITCNHPFPDVEYYSLHILKEHLSSAVICEFCRKVFYDGKLLKQHVIKHEVTKISSAYKCSQCKEYFADKNDLEHHENNSHEFDDGSVDLRQCFSMLSSLMNMNIWKFFEVRNENTTYNCTFCKFDTSDCSTYISHLQDEKVKLFTCDNCCEVFLNRARLLMHVRSNKPKCVTYERKNTTERNCKSCNQRFPPSSLKRHVKMCKGMTCTECSADFKTFEQYTVHLKQHVKSLHLSTCKFCHRQFVGQDALEKHFDRTHKDTIHQYKYKCKNCDQLFMHPKYLFAHYFTKHKDLQPYTCKICDKPFKIRKQFTIHIKLHHKSIGFVEFDENYHVFFNDKKSEKPFQPYPLIETDRNGKPLDYNLRPSEAGKRVTNDKPKKHTDSTTDFSHDDETDIDNVKKPSKEENKKPTDEVKEEQLNQKKVDSHLAQDDYNIMNATETEYQTETENCVIEKRKRKTMTRSRKKMKHDIELDLSSDDSDMPLLSVKNKGRTKFLKGDRFKPLAKSRWTRDKFMCKKCNKYCYTYQNYHNHLALHEKNKTKECIKCNKKFKSKTDLNAHIETDHSSSKLTETLKQLIERKKVTKNTHLPMDQKSIAVGIRRTIKKVLFEKSNETTTLTRVDNKLSVKNFFENFTPEPSDSKDLKNNKVSIKLVDTNEKPKTSFIKMKKFYPERYISGSRLRMPVKFKEGTSEKFKVSIKLVPISQTQPVLRLTQKIEHEDHTYDADNDHNYDIEPDNDYAEEREDSIPEVAEEVMLNTEPSEKQETIILPNLPKEYSNLRIAHLQEKAPFYKIVKIDEVMKKSKKSEASSKPPDKIVLPDGTKLVTVNPLAHLMGDTKVDDLFKTQKKYYETKPRDIKVAIAKALNANKTTRKKKRESDF